MRAGIDPSKSTVFVQSHVRAHTELTWLLNCATPMNWLEKMIQFKEKAIKQVCIPAGKRLPRGLPLRTIVRAQRSSVSLIRGSVLSENGAC